MEYSHHISGHHSHNCIIKTGLCYYSNWPSCYRTTTGVAYYNLHIGANTAEIVTVSYYSCAVYSPEQFSKSMYILFRYRRNVTEFLPGLEDYYLNQN
jgi:hypothetical protein